MFPLVVLFLKANVTTLRLANAIANPSVCRLSVCRLKRACTLWCTLYSGGLTFRGYFCTVL